MAILAASVITTSGVGLLWRRHHAHVAVAKTVSALPWKASPLPIPTALRFESVRGISADPQGSVYVADSEDYTVYRVTPDGHRTMLVGSPRSPGTADGGSTTARFSILWGIAADQSGNVFVSDGSRIRKITPKWATETLAGLAGTPGEVDGASRKARFDRPSGVAADSQGNVYVADAYTIRKVTPGGATSTLAGKPGHAGSLDGVGGEALFSDQAKGLAVNSAGNVFVADSLNCTIRKITPDGVVSTIAGSAGRPGSVDGPGRKARFFRPGGLAVDASGRVYVADTYNQTIRMVTPDGVASTIAGSPGQPGNQDGPAAQARFRFPGPVAVDAAGDVFVGDTGNHTIRKISPAGLVTTLTAQE
jgi:sugar lactone lactonase YvrE